MLFKALLHGGLRDGDGRLEAFELKSDGRKGGHTYDEICVLYFVFAICWPSMVLSYARCCGPSANPRKNFESILFEFRDEFEGLFVFPCLGAADASSPSAIPSASRRYLEVSRGIWRYLEVSAAS